jgi:hypothetical protein
MFCRSWPTVGIRFGCLGLVQDPQTKYLQPIRTRQLANGMICIAWLTLLIMFLVKKEERDGGAVQFRAVY